MKNPYFFSILTLLVFALFTCEKREMKEPKPDYQSRREALRKMAPGGVVVVSNGDRLYSSNMLYLSGVQGKGASLAFSLEEDKEALFLPKELKEKHIATDIKGILDLEDLGKWLNKALRAAKAKKIWCDDPKHFDKIVGKGVDKALKISFKDLELKPLGEIVDTLRVVKDAYEIDCLKKATEIAVEVMNETMAYVKPGMTEREVAQFVTERLKQKGADSSRVGFALIQAGLGSTLPHGLRQNLPLRAGEVVILDMGAVYKGYCSDITRAVPVSGFFTKRQAEVYGILQKIQRGVEERIEPGLSLADVHKIAEDLLAQYGYEKYFIHYLGHYIGIEGHDVGNREWKLKPGTFITNEPGIYIPEEGIGFRIEDMVMVTENGAVNLSAGAPREIKAIEDSMAKRSSFEDFTLWSKIDADFADKRISLIKINPHNQEQIFVGTYSSGLFRSDDGGETWVRSDSGIFKPKFWCLAFDPKNPKMIYAGTHRREALYRSTDGGESWEKWIGQACPARGTRKQSYVTDSVVDPENPSILYFSALWDGLFKSTDGGKSWTPKPVTVKETKEGKEATLQFNEVTAIALDPVNTKILYAGSYWDGLFKSVDAAEHWREAGLEGRYIYDIAVNP
ncbi:MAG: M24 family metallopeptidase, partial [Candidatus Zixiibacteriota bacterium]